MKKAIIVGSAGQDGRLAYEYLSKKGYAVVGIDRYDTSRQVSDMYQEVSINIENTEEVCNLIKEIEPDEIYYLAAFHHSSEDRIVENIELLQKSYRIHVLAFANFLEGVRMYSLKTRIFYAASSLIFGDVKSNVQTETTVFRPNSVYGITKLDGLYLSRMYRDQYGVFVSVGILYNHESGYRPKKFLSKKIVSTALDIKRGKETQLILGDLKAKVDWGYAPDYIDAMYKMLQLENSGEFIVATGKVHSVLYFVKTVFDELGMDWKRYVKEDNRSITRKRNVLSGNSLKLRRLTKWKPSVTFEQMIKKLIEECHE